MPIEITQGSLEEKIIRRLLEVYPITLDELRFDIKVSEEIMMRGIKALVIRGIIELEQLPDKTFIRLLRQDFVFVGRKATQRKRFKHKGGRKKGKDYEGIMYG
jgi:DNA-binding transcriptional ArsR family regulator